MLAFFQPLFLQGRAATKVVLAETVGDALKIYVSNEVFQADEVVASTTPSNSVFLR